MKLPFKQEEFLGNIRSGKKKDNNSPCNIDHFNVHYDSYTSEYSIELFESLYKDKTDRLLITTPCLLLGNIFVLALPYFFVVFRNMI